MPATDMLRRFSFVDLPIRGQWVRMEHVLADAFRHKAYPAVVEELLGQMFAAVVMFADNLKFEGAVALQSQGDGALTRSLAECRGQHFLRGIAHLDTDRPQPRTTNLRDWLGAGRLALSLIPEQSNQQPYQGLVELEHANLAANLEHYFATSEQLQTRIFFASRTQATTGLLLQRLPDADDAGEVELDAAEDAWHTLTTLAATVTDDELASLDATTLLRRLFHEYPLRVREPRELTYRCTCTRAKSDQTLRVFGAEELDDILRQDGEINVDCEFCGTKYRYDAVDVAALKHNLETHHRRGPRH
jgi:molecular chaperone Hsp33